MARHTAAELQIVTANRLADGVVVFLGDAGEWTTELQSAAVAGTGDEVLRLLGQAERDVVAARVVGPYPVAVERSAGLCAPLALRERIRAQGLTFRAIAADAVTWL